MTALSKVAYFNVHINVCLIRHISKLEMSNCGIEQNMQL